MLEMVINFEREMQEKRSVAIFGSSFCRGPERLLQRAVQHGAHTSVDLTSRWSLYDGTIEEFPFDNELYKRLKWDEHM